MLPSETMEIRRRPSREEINRSEIMLATSCSWRRFVFNTRTGDFATPITQRDGHPDILFEGGEKTGQRMAECWNACRGIPTEALEAGVVEKAIALLEDWQRVMDAATAGADLSDPVALDEDSKRSGKLLDDTEAATRALLRQIKGDQHG